MDIAWLLGVVAFFGLAGLSVELLERLRSED